MHVIEVIALIMLAVAVRAAFVYFSPYRECRWCRGRRIGRRCWRCKGTKLTRRIGARQVHKTRLSARQARDEWRRP